jgi:hypothetical protein
MKRKFEDEKIPQDNKKIAPDELGTVLPDFRYRKFKIWQGNGSLAGEFWRYEHNYK